MGPDVNLDQLVKLLLLGRVLEVAHLVDRLLNGRRDRITSLDHPPWQRPLTRVFALDR